MTAREWFGIAVLNSKIYVFGGRDTCFSNVNTVEVFDVKQNLRTSGGKIQAGPTSSCSISNIIYFLDVFNEKLYKHKKAEIAGYKSSLEIEKNVHAKGILLPLSHRYLSYHLFDLV